MRSLFLLLCLTATAGAQCCGSYYDESACYGGVCQGGGGGYYQPCQPQYRQPPPRYYPPQPRQPEPEPDLVPIKDPVANAPKAVPFDWDEYDKRQAKLIAAIESNKCHCEKVDLEPLNKKIDMLTAAIAAMNKPQPTPPPVHQTPPPTKEAEQHVVIVADQNKEWWPRLSDQIRRTEETYTGITVAPLPDFPIGIIPQAVVYKNNTPVRVARGAHEVEELLSQLSRGYRF